MIISFIKFVLNVNRNEVFTEKNMRQESGITSNHWERKKPRRNHSTRPFYFWV